MRGSEPGFWRLNAGGLLMGSGIGAMHYSGMAAMLMPASTVYEPRWFAASILVAHVLATLSLATKFRFVQSQDHAGAPLWVSSALMGCAVAGMHYTAMLASYHLPDAGKAIPTVSLSPFQLGVGVSSASLFILGLSIISSVVDRRLQGGGPRASAE